jgi:hypothetical protein
MVKAELPFACAMSTALQVRHLNPPGPLPTMNMQALINGLRQQWQRERANSQLTLGGLITALEAMPRGAQVANLRDPGSYRGYYEDLYFEQQFGTRPASELLADCKEAMGKVFIGYKGGEFVMGESTPLWVATYGRCGERLLVVHAGGEIGTGADDD